VVADVRGSGSAFAVRRRLECRKEWKVSHGRRRVDLL
jgi:hypothetical protein